MMILDFEIRYEDEDGNVTKTYFSDEFGFNESDLDG